MAGMNGGGDPPKIVASQYCFLVDGVEVALEDYVAGLLSGDQGTEEQAAAIKAAIEACIAVGLKPETGAIWLAIKDCIGSKPVVIEEVGEDPAAAAAAAAAGQLPGTLIIHPGNGTAADPDWVWYVNGDGTVTNIESPSGITVTPVVASGDPAAPAGPTTLTVTDQNGQPRTLCEGTDGTEVELPICPTPADPNRLIITRHLDRDDKSEVVEKVADHTSSCIVGNSKQIPPTASVSLSAGESAIAITEVAASFVNTSSYREMAVNMVHSGTEFFIYSGGQAINVGMIPTNWVGFLPFFSSASKNHALSYYDGAHLEADDYTIPMWQGCLCLAPDAAHDMFIQYDINVNAGENLQISNGRQSIVMHGSTK